MLTLDALIICFFAIVAALAVLMIWSACRAAAQDERDRIRRELRQLAEERESEV
jgi:hypothetical protein